MKDTLPRSSVQVAQWLSDQMELRFDSRSSVIAVLHRLGIEHRKPEEAPAKAEVEKQEDFIELYERRRNNLESDEAATFVDAILGFSRKTIAEKFRKIGATFAIIAPISSKPLTLLIFGFWPERGIIRINHSPPLRITNRSSARSRRMQFVKSATSSFKPTSL